MLEVDSSYKLPLFKKGVIRNLFCCFRYSKAPAWCSPAASVFLLCPRQGRCSRAALFVWNPSAGLTQRLLAGRNMILRGENYGSAAVAELFCGGCSNPLATRPESLDWCVSYPSMESTGLRESVGFSSRHRILWR